jgi:hypothetical protein
MNTTQATEAAAAQTDANLDTLVSLYGGRAVRDGQGNLRGLTADEETFGKALRNEAKRRGLR